MRQIGKAGGTIVASLLLGVSTQVLAQTQAGDQPSSEEKVRADGEIVVTARKRDELLSEVPIAVSALGSDELSLLALDDVTDYIRQLPGASLVSAGPEYLNDISIRGQGGGRQGFNEAAVGIYRNGIYVAGGGFGGRTFNRLDFFDVKAIETYRGPQGALYGRNAVGGAVNVISNRPDPSRFAANGKLGYEDPGQIEVSGVVNAPVGGNVAVRLGGFYIDQYDGFYRNLPTGKITDKKEFLGGRVGIRWDVDARNSLTVTFETLESTTPSFSNLGRRIAGTTLNLPAALGGPQTGQFDPSPFQGRDSQIPYVKINEQSAFVELESDLGFADLTGVFAFKNRNAGRFDEDLDHFLGYQGIVVNGIATDIRVQQTEDFKRYGGELRLASKAGSAVEWLVGADYQTFDDFVITANSGTAGVANLRTLASRYEQFTDELKSFSFFGQLGFSLSDPLKLTVEGRVQHDERDFNFFRRENNAIRIATGALNAEVTKFLPAATLSYTFADKTLLYGRLSSGFRPGGFNTAIDASQARFLGYGPETAYSAEVGLKGRLSSRISYNLATYYVITKDVQAVTNLSTTDTSTALQNVGDTDIYGLEAEINGRFPLGPGQLRASANFSTTNGTFSDGSTITTTGGGNVVEVVNLGGARVNRTRDYIVAANLFYFLPVGRGYDVFFGGGIQTEGGGFENATGDTISTTGRKLDDFLLADARVGIKSGHWQLSLYVKNLTDKVYRVQNVIQNEFFNEPRKFGAELKVNF